MTKAFFAVLTFIVLTLPLAVFADDLQIVDVRRNIPLSDSDPVYKDFYITAAPGLKKNLVVNVMRKWAVRDSLGSQTLGEIYAPVGQLKIIGVYGKIAVAREYKLIDRDDEPMLEQIGIMTGDHVVLDGAFTDSKKKKTAHVTDTSVAPLAPAAVTAAVPVPAPEGAAPTRSTAGTPEAVKDAHEDALNHAKDMAVNATPAAAPVESSKPESAVAPEVKAQ